MSDWEVEYSRLFPAGGDGEGLPLHIALSIWKDTFTVPGRWGHADMFIFWAEASLEPNVTVSKAMWEAIPKLIKLSPDGYYNNYKIGQRGFPVLIDKFVIFACENLGLPPPARADVNFSVFEPSQGVQSGEEGTELTLISNGSHNVRTPNDLINEFLGTPFENTKPNRSDNITDNKESEIGWMSSSSERKNDDGFVGLENQGATCYLNSVLQSLYMTPEFRNAIYSYHTPESDKHKSEDGSISEQLQTIFAMLQTSSLKSVQTTGLTKSFGWNSFEAFEQHDVQELFQILLDEVQKDFQLIGSKNSPDKFFEIYTNDYVMCMKCGNQSSRVARGLDLSLPVKGCASVEEALSNFLKPEILEGAEAYRCDLCNERVLAEKGLKLDTLPFILNCTLKRFDLDLETLTRIKLGHRLTFPFILDLKPFLSKDVSSSTKYELYSVMVHLGGAFGGHYYAYIKDLDQGKWYCFNDRSVSLCDEDVIKEAFGADKSSSTAYVLLYRRIENSNEHFTTVEKIPQHLKNKVKQEDEDNDLSLIQISVFRKVGDRKDSRTLKLSKELPLMAAEDLIYEKLDLFKEDIARDQIRIRFYNKFSNELMNPFRKEDALTPIDFLKFYNSRCVMVEVRKKDEEFPESTENQLCLHVSKFNNDTLNPDAPKDVYVNKNQTYAQLVKAILDSFSLQLSQRIQLVKISQGMYGKKSSTVDCLDPTRTIGTLNLFGGTKLIIVQDEEIARANLSRYLDSQKNVIGIKFNLPETGFDYDQHTFVDRSWTVTQLKNHLAPFIGLNPSEFILGKGAFLGETSVFGDESTRLDDAAVIDGSCIHVKLGDSKKASEINTKISLYDVSKQEIQFLFELSLDHRQLVIDVKKTLLVHLREFFQKNASIESMRLRECSDSKVGKVLSNSKTLLEQLPPQILFEEMHILVQYIDVPDPDLVDQATVLIIVQRFNSSSFSLDERQELWINTLATTNQVEQRISSFTGIKSDHLRIAKPVLWHGDLLDVPTFLWRRLADDFSQDKILAHSGLDLSNGTVIVVKDDTEPVKVLSDEERKELQSMAVARKIARENELFGGIFGHLGSGSVGKLPMLGKEHGIKIKSRHQNKHESGADPKSEAL